MMKTFNIISVTALALLFYSCAHHRDVRPGADGVHRVVIPTDDTDAASRDAIAQAQHYCESLGKSAAFIDEKNSYKGSMSEENYKAGKTASKVAKAVGSAGYVFGGKNESAAGGIVGLGGAIGDSVLGNGYQVEMKFKCQ